MATAYRPYAPEQSLPPPVPDWLPDGHLAYFTPGTVDALDLSVFHAGDEGDSRGW